MAAVYAIVTILAWGTWLAPSQRVRLPNQQVRMLAVTLINVLVAAVVASLRGFGAVTWSEFWLPFIGGLIWAVSGLCAFTASSRLGIAKAFGIWAPLNILVSLAAGWLMFGEFRELSQGRVALLFASVAIILVGVVMIIFAKGSSEAQAAPRARRYGYLAAFAAGVLWGIYYMPVQVSGATVWAAAFPLAIGMFLGSVVLQIVGRATVLVQHTADYLKLAATGALWTLGNYGMLLLVSAAGAGKGYTFAQLSVVVNALIGVYWLRDPQPKSRAAYLTLSGCVLATIGGLLLSRVK